ncbi:ATP-dependent nuclease [Mucilaginibacter kameinonensis]|uniref:ATP-dependent nuclease n=1 Tax=Mucilaginibacter kameinonensis TaxID=452286 RepID=UPI000EF7A515|nr:AAA family ATPase [Mucilaginibacter kameinonensis]
MFLVNLKLWNFRIFGNNKPFDLLRPHLNLTFNQGINVLIGENDSGKTAIIDAIKIVLKTHSTEWIRVEEEDFFQDSERFRIECRFKGFTDDEAKYFTEWLDWETGPNGGEPYLTVYYDVSRRNGRIMPTDIKAGIDDTGHVMNAEAKEMLRTTYLRPLRDAKSELSPKRNSRLSQILYSHKAFQDKKNHRLITLAKLLNEEIAGYFKGQSADGQSLTSENDLLGKDVKEVIDEYLRRFSNKSTEFKMTRAELKGILESLSLLFQDGYNLGLGSHNLLCIASELLHLKKNNWDGLRLGLIEEIEAHLHPQVQLQVVETLKAHSADMQLIFTTHSPNIGSKIPLENLIICHGGKVFPLRKGTTELDDEDYQFLEIFLDTTKANLFFAKGIILVEGWAEELLVPSLAKAIGIDLTAHGVAIINVGSTAYLRYSKIFQRKEAPLMEIPVAIVTDVDIRTYEKSQKKDAAGKLELDTEGKSTYVYIKRDGPTVESETKAAVKQKDESSGIIQYYIGDKWTLEYALYHSEALQVLFKELAEKVHSKTDWKTGWEAKLAEKLIEKRLDKTEIAYRLANTINQHLVKDPERLLSPLKEINLADSDSDAIGYLLKAIRHASGN